MKGGPKTFLNWASDNLQEEAFSKLENVVGYSGRNDKFVARADGIWDLGNNLSLVGAFERSVSYLKNRPIKRCLHDASGIIYQSRFSKISCEKKWPQLRNTPSTIIVNPLATQRVIGVNWSGRSDSRSVKIVSYHRHTPLKGSYLAIQLAAHLQTALKKKVELYIIGTIPQLVKHWYSQSATAVDCMLIEENGFDAFIHHAKDSNFVLNLAHFDPCPNVVLECVSIGVPVIAVRSGGITDILGDSYEFLMKPFFQRKSWIKKNILPNEAVLDFEKVALKLLEQEFDQKAYEFVCLNSNESEVARQYESFILSHT